MQITDVRIRKIETEGKLKAVVSITIDDVFVVHDVKLIEGEQGRFIAMPSKKTANYEFKDVAHPINTKTRQEMQETVIAAYDKLMQEESAVEEF